MAEKITPRVDLAFKKLFGVEENKDLLISLINSIVTKEDQVADVDILNPYNPRDFKNDKLSILDIKAKSHTGKRYNIEIQISDEADYDKRALYYWAKLYIEQLQKSEDYSVLNKAIGIHILNFTSIPSTDQYHTTFQLLEVKNHLHYFKDIELHTIELNKFEGTPAKNMGKAEELKLLLPKIKTSLDRWAAFLTRYYLLEAKRLPKELKDSKLEKALEVLEVMNFTKQEREAYEEHLKWLRIEANTLKKAFTEGKAKGIQLGEQKGRTDEKLEITKNMLSQGIDIKVIAKSTGLTVEQVEKIKKEIDQEE